jgi:hypothetical protein
VDGDQVGRLRHALRDTGWWTRALSLGAAVRRTRSSGGLLVVGPPEEEPWHFTAHLDDAARWSGQDQLRPTLLRWAPPAGAPPHLAVGLERLEAAGRGETIVVVAPADSPSDLLERVADARRTGATVLSVDTGDPELDGLAHERFTVGPAGLLLLGDPGSGFAVAQHLVSSAVGEPATKRLLSRRR